MAPNFASQPKRGWQKSVAPSVEVTASARSSLQHSLRSVTSASAHETVSKSSSYGHLFVVDAGSGSGGFVDAFPLDCFGLPASRPDSILSGPGGAFGAAVDSRGNLYVTQLESVRTLDKFARGAHGHAAPTRTFTFSGHEPEFVAVDHRNFLYFSIDNTSLNIYRPAASGNAKPTKIIDTPNLITDVVLDARGTLYSSELAPDPVSVDISAA